MSRRSDALAQQFEEANAAAIAYVERCGDAEWRATSRDEGWPAAFTAWHIGDACAGVMAMVRAIATGGPPPNLTRAMLDELNARKLAEHRAPSKEEALQQLRRNGTTIVAGIRALSDEQLDRTAAMPMLDGNQLSVEQLIEGGLISHARSHLASIRAAAATA